MQLHQYRVNLGTIAMKWFSTLHRGLGMEPHYQDTRLSGLIPSADMQLVYSTVFIVGDIFMNNQCELYSQLS